MPVFYFMRWNEASRRGKRCSYPGAGPRSCRPVIRWGRDVQDVSRQLGHGDSIIRCENQMQIARWLADHRHAAYSPLVGIWIGDAHPGPGLTDQDLLITTKPTSGEIRNPMPPAPPVPGPKLVQHISCPVSGQRTCSRPPRPDPNGGQGRGRSGEDQDGRVGNKADMAGNAIGMDHNSALTDRLTNRAWIGGSRPARISGG